MRLLSEPVISMAEFKRILAREGDTLEVLVKHGPREYLRGFNVYLPGSCRPSRARVLFAYYAGSYLMFFENPVQYCGANPYLETLCSTEAVRADDWGDLMDFCLMLPEYL